MSQQKFTPTPESHGHEPVDDWNLTAKRINKSHGRKPVVWGFTEKILWTNHARDKMRHYRLTEARIKRIIRHPTRVEEGILDGAVAAMQPAESKRYAEIWVMYILVKSKISARGGSAFGGKDQRSKLRVITAWRYPGKSPTRDPVPKEILAEIQRLI